jgi:hypothetical protein
MRTSIVRSRPNLTFGLSLFPLPSAYAMIPITDGGSDVSPDSFQVLSFWSPGDLRNGIFS